MSGKPPRPYVSVEDAMTRGYHDIWLCGKVGRCMPCGQQLRHVAGRYQCEQNWIEGCPDRRPEPVHVVGNNQYCKRCGYTFRWTDPNGTTYQIRADALREGWKPYQLRHELRDAPNTPRWNTRNGFYDWLRLQCNRGDDIGGFASVETLRHGLRPKRLKGWHLRLTRFGMNATAHEALDRAWKEYENGRQDRSENECRRK